MFSKKEKSEGEQKAYTNAAFVNQFLIAELCMAFETKGVFEYIAAHPAIDNDAAKTLGLRYDLLMAACDFLAERNVFEKRKGGSFYLARNYENLRRPSSFLLAYKNVFESLGSLMDGTKTYGEEIIRDASKLGTATHHAIPYLLDLVKKRGITSALDVGCGTGNCLSALAEHIKGFRGAGIEIDEKTATIAKERFADGRYGNMVQIYQGDAEHPEHFPKESKNTEAIISIAVFHEFRRNNKIGPLLQSYKHLFPSQRLYLVEFDAPEWNELIRMPETAKRAIASQYLLTHYFSEQGLPQSKEKWTRTLEENGWTVVSTTETDVVPLVIFECS